MRPGARRRVCIGIGTAALLAVSPPTLEAGCTLSVQGGVSFGTYNVFAPAPLDTTGRISYQCDRSDHGIRITLDRGGSATFLPRRLANGVQQLEYNLFTDAARTEIWGDQTEGTGVYYRKNPPNNNWVNVTIYGRIPAGQDVAAGSYGDTIRVDINF